MYLESAIFQMPDREALTHTQHRCHICGESCPKYNSYGGFSCQSCRAFFRRSVQSSVFKSFFCKHSQNCIVDKTTRRECKFCRFRKCLQCGMRTTYVLSEEEKRIRFRNFFKSQQQNGEQNPLVKSFPELNMKLTLEEIKLIEEAKGKYQMMGKSGWFKSFAAFDCEVGSNLLESTFGLSTIKFHTWCLMDKSFQHFFNQEVVPQFINVANVGIDDRDRIIRGKGPLLAHLFKMCVSLNTSPHQVNPIVIAKYVICQEAKCAFPEVMITLIYDQHLSKCLELSAILCRMSLEIGQTPRFPTYDDIFYPGWAEDSEVETRHKEKIQKIQDWPKDENNQFDFDLFLLMSLMLIFCSDESQLGMINKVEKHQLHYCILLQRCLRSKMDPDMANKKYIEAMTILSYVEEIYELNCRRFA